MVRRCKKKMIYVYSKHIQSGEENLCKIFDNYEQAIEHMRFCYNIDKLNNMLGEYCYFAKEH